MQAHNLVIAGMFVFEATISKGTTASRCLGRQGVRHRCVLVKQIYVTLLASGPLRTVWHRWLRYSSHERTTWRPILRYLHHRYGFLLVYWRRSLLVCCQPCSDGKRAVILGILPLVVLCLGRSIGRKLRRNPFLDTLGRWGAWVSPSAVGGL